MDSNPESIARAYFDESIASLVAAKSDPGFFASIGVIARAVEASLKAGGKILLAGNGGSAGDAQHIAGEFLSRLNFDRAPLAAIALTTDTSVLTAIGNDYGFERVFERQVLGLGNRGDVFIGISTSGRSPNIIKAFVAARQKGLTTIGFAGADPGEMGAHCDLLLRAPTRKTPLIQQIHIVVAHVVCGQVERSLFPDGAGREP